MIVDSHCHLNRLDLEAFDGSLDKALDEARANGVEHFLTVAVELSDIDELKLIAKRPDVSYSVGWHPTSVYASDKLDWLLQEGALEKCVALGETGLDYYHVADDSHRNVQKQLFAAHIEASKQLKKPIIVHTRAASNDTIDLIKAEHARDIGGVMHCFTEDWDIAKACLDENFMISISGIVTFKNAKIVQEVASKVPLDRLLIETDSPYLAPMPHRGKSNHPAFVKYVAEYIANLRGIPYQTLADATTANFYRLFGIHR